MFINEREKNKFVIFRCFHRFVDEFNDIYEFIITGYFLWALLNMCSSLLVFRMQLVEYNLVIKRIKLSFSKGFFPFFSHIEIRLKSGRSSNRIDIIVIILLLFWAFSIIFLYCEIGERVTHEFNEFNEQFCQCNWYSFSIEMQRMFIIVMSNTQRPAIIQGYANTVCTRDAFKQVRRVGRFVLSAKTAVLYKIINQ